MKFLGAVSQWENMASLFWVRWGDEREESEIEIKVLTCMARMLLGTNSLYCLMVKCHVFILMRSSKVNSKISLPSVHTWKDKQGAQWLCTWGSRRFCNSHVSHSTQSPWLLLGGAWSWQKCGTDDVSKETGISSEINGVKGQHSSSPGMSYW